MSVCNVHKDFFHAVAAFVARRTGATGLWRAIGGTATLLGCAMIAVGCATRRIDDNALARLMEEWREPAESPAMGPQSDAPEAPGSGLPLLPSDTGRDVADRAITIQPDSILQIAVREDPSLDGSYRVNEIGAVELGYIGPVILFNKTEQEAAATIRDVLRTRAFRKATVDVKMSRASYDRVKVVGDVGNPGLIRIGAGSSISLNDALLRAGGIRASARGVHVRFIEGGITNALASAMEGVVHSMFTEDGKPSVPDLRLRNNDMVFVFSRRERSMGQVGEKEITVLGEVHRPGLYRFSGSEPCTMMHLIFKMGGLPPYANRKALRLIRRDEEGRETETIVNVEKILETGRPEDDMILENGDRVIVPARRLSLF